MKELLMEVYIVGSATFFPESYCNKYILEKIYNSKNSNSKSLRMANILSKNVGISQRCISIDLELYPKKVMCEENDPCNWLMNIINKIKINTGCDNLDFISISYNISSHKDTIPTLACKVGHAANVNNKHPPEEIVNYGCASGIFSILSAYIKSKKEPLCSLVSTFEQSSWIFNPIYDYQHNNFKSSLRGHSIFSDGSAGILIASGEKAKQFKNKVRIVDVLVDFEFGEEIGMRDGDFLIGVNVKNVMPKLVTNKVILTILKRNNLEVSEIKEWSIHQGGETVLNMFTDEKILGLNEMQIKRSKTMYKKYGNISTPSCLVVFDSFFNERYEHDKNGHLGLIIGYGAGYYMGAVLYQY